MSQNVLIMLNLVVGWEMYFFKNICVAVLYFNLNYKSVFFSHTYVRICIFQSFFFGTELVINRLVKTLLFWRHLPISLEAEVTFNATSEFTSAVC